MASAIHIPESVFLGIHALARLASERNSEKLADLLITPGSVDHLSKVMQKLSKAGMVNSRRGRNGGFTLAVAPSDIRLMDIWIAIEGTFESSICPYAGNGCSLVSCLLGSAVTNASEVIRDYLSSTTVEDLGRIVRES